MIKKIVIAIDGPAGSGKSTVSKIIATKNNYEFINSGLFYRACAFVLRDYNIATLEKCFFLNFIKDYHFTWKDSVLYINDIDYTEQLKTNIISNNASAIAQKKFVREYVNNLIRQLSKNMNIIMDGRDIGTIVFPHADLKLFLVASIFTRAKRRYLELHKSVSLLKLIKDIFIRDWNDKKRKNDPLLKAKDAIKINTTKYSIDQIVTKIEAIMKQRNFI